MKPIQAVWGMVLVALLASSFMLSWQFHHYMDYAYAFWYHSLNIEQHIDKYAPQNRFIKGFQETSTQQHIDLFGEIVDAVHSHGQGLANIAFTDQQGGRHILLREPEVIHLQDVANLIDTLTLAGWVCATFSLVGIFLLVRQKVAIHLLSQLGFVLSLILILMILMFAIGPKDVFYQMHIWVFPEEHQWFFYYQESLMSTLMKAPDLFGGIAASLSLLALIIFLVFMMCLARLTAAFDNPDTA